MQLFGDREGLARPKKSWHVGNGKGSPLIDLYHDITLSETPSKELFKRPLHQEVFADDSSAIAPVEKGH